MGSMPFDKSWKTITTMKIVGRSVVSQSLLYLYTFSVLPSLSPISQATIALLSLKISLHCPEFYIIGNINYIIFRIWLLLLNIIILRDVSMLLNVSVFHTFLLINSIPLYRYTTVWPYRYCWTSCMFPGLGYYRIVRYEHLCLGLYVDIHYFFFFQLIPKSGMPPSFGKCARNCQVIFQNVYTILHKHQYLRVLVLPYPHQQLV